jgi:hypothetical protein
MQAEWTGNMKRLSWSPRAWLLEGFLSDAECDHLIKIGGTNLQKSLVVNPVTGASEPSTIRTSSGMFLNMHYDDVVAAIERRVAQVFAVRVLSCIGYFFIYSWGTSSGYVSSCFFCMCCSARYCIDCLQGGSNLPMRYLAKHNWCILCI